ncbi:MAG: shikimate dehydrogenase [Lautropia sp.]|nr:MAG: shikimate dehydrogenase [Pseudomonadota bacterium]MBC6960175.1 shikimate dehydrogenase [Lautropia sp.]MCL4702269.1 shikimate dehydrogenase [Burkholderiaceae bacterium]MDL1906419.1 shikimate dehydrogenase [Betaproteobacteria bacterium PRO1]RIK90159.1 MAG: shikimate dehydrogenase [Burkholderiales bacterium]
MTDRYAVIGNPVAHSRSPSIHARFAKQTGEDLEYGRLLVPLDGFVEAVERFRDAGGRGLNVTLPFKPEAFAWAARRSERAQVAGAVNTLRFDREGAWGDNTDGAGLVRDLEGRLELALAGRSVLILGAGGATRGVLGPLLDAGVARLTIANRTPGRAIELVDEFLRTSASAAAAADRLRGCGFDDAGDGHDLVVNATSAGLAGDRLPIADALLAGAVLAYDMFYAARETAFVAQALAAGCRRACDGLGMLVEQAAESFLVWRGVRPLTAPVYEALRAELAAEAG